MDYDEMCIYRKVPSAMLTSVVFLSEHYTKP
jgi:hypothetical protein